jgi:hypothetical protein
MSLRDLRGKQAMQGQDVVLRSVHPRERPGTVRAFRQQRTRSLPAVIDTDDAASERDGVQCIPTASVIDRAGRMVGRTVGPKAWDSDKVKALLVSLIHQPLREVARPGAGGKRCSPGGTIGMANQPSTIQTLKHILKMGACCAGPILGLALLAPLAGTLGIGVGSILSTLLVLACPLSMLVMMYFMMREQKAERPSQERDEGQPLAEMTAPRTAGAIAEGDVQPEGGKALPLAADLQTAAAIERATPRRNSSVSQA